MIAAYEIQGKRLSIPRSSPPKNMAIVAGTVPSTKCSATTLFPAGARAGLKQSCNGKSTRNLRYMSSPLSSHLHSCSLKKGRNRQVAAKASPSASSAEKESRRRERAFHGECFVLDDNIDTDQIIPAEFLTLVPSKADEYEKLGSYAMCGLPARYGKFMSNGATKTNYPIIIAGANFGCGSSREHAPVCLGAAGVRAIVAESYARIFFRNSVSTGEVYPLESEGRICDEFKTGNIVTVDLDANTVTNHTTGKNYVLKPIGDAGPVIDAGGIFNYARLNGMIATASP